MLLSEVIFSPCLHGVPFKDKRQRQVVNSVGGHTLTSLSASSFGYIIFSILQCSLSTTLQNEHLLYPQIPLFSPDSLLHHHLLSPCQKHLLWCGPKISCMSTHNLRQQQSKYKLSLLHPRKTRTFLWESRFWHLLWPNLI